jgi:hypothetical protein
VAVAELHLMAVAVVQERALAVSVLRHHFQ